MFKDPTRGPMGGELYLLSYHCTSLRVPRLCAMPSLTAGHFTRALVSCIMRARIIPDVVRTDRGPVMTSQVNAELLALCGVRHLKGSAFTPRHQGPGEREHLTIMINHQVLLHEICKCFPQEWAALVPALEYLLETAPSATLRTVSL